MNNTTADSGVIFSPYIMGVDFGFDKEDDVRIALHKLGLDEGEYDDLFSFKSRVGFSSRYAICDSILNGAVNVQC